MTKIYDKVTLSYGRESAQLVSKLGDVWGVGDGANGGIWNPSCLRKSKVRGNAAYIGIFDL